jgi:dihydrofolate reductase
MIISAIVAIGKNKVIGLDNQIPWYLPADLKYFKKITTGHHILMGRKCYDSIGKPLPNRANIIVTRDLYFIVSNALVVHHIEEGIKLALNRGERELFIIGGGEIYKQSMPFWDRLYLTEVDYEGAGDVFFPEIDLKNWKKTFEELHDKDNLNNFAYSFITYERAP